MEVSGEAADLVVKESLQVAETAAKLAGTGAVNVAALLMALAREDHKVSGKTSARRLAKDNAPSVVIPLKKEDMKRFGMLAKQYGVLYFLVKEKNSNGDIVHLISNQNYASLLNAIFETMGYPIAEHREDSRAKKAASRTQQENVSSERGSGLKSTEKTDERPSVRKKLEQLKAAQEAKVGKRREKTR